MSNWGYCVEPTACAVASGERGASRSLLCLVLVLHRALEASLLLALGRTLVAGLRSGLETLRAFL
jgi:hypothetical protein